MKNEKVAAIDIGSKAIRMTIAQISDTDFDILEEVRHQVGLGKDSFEYGKLLRPTMNDAISLLRKYKRLCEEYKVSRLVAVATTAVREALNFDIFIDNIRTLTGIEVDILTPSKETEYIFKALKYHVLPQYDDKSSNEDLYGIIDIGAGSVEITIFNQQNIIYSQELPLGTLKMKQIFNRGFRADDNFSKYLKVMVEHEIHHLKRNIAARQVSRVYGIAGELEYLSRILNKDSKDLPPVDVKELSKLCKRMEDWSEEEVIHKLGIPYDIAETFYPLSFMFLQLVEMFHCDSIVIPEVTLRDGIMQDFLHAYDQESYYTWLESQLRINATNIGRSLNFDEKHAIHVTGLALQIFDQTVEFHHLGPLERCYLLVAGLLHDVGSSLSNRAHHKHSMYIIKAQDLFCFDQRQTAIIANVARYHRKSMPKTSHPDYMNLTHTEKMTVMKLAAVLRIADSLDNTHLQLVKSVSLEKERSRFVLRADVTDQIFAERYSFKNKRDMFEEVFGQPIKLRT
jgi:exopolyphosphatase/guanosine-5'-triphosphate,3'-diphosphate pyrophosphatase